MNQWKTSKVMVSLLVAGLFISGPTLAENEDSSRGEVKQDREQLKKDRAERKDAFLKKQEDKKKLIEDKKVSRFFANWTFDANF